MNKDQRECFDAVYKQFHDEYHDNKNLAGVITVLFPEGVKDDNEIGILLRRVITPALEARSELGNNVMKILYQIKKDYKL